MPTFQRTGSVSCFLLPGFCLLLQQPVRLGFVDSNPRCLSVQALEEGGLHVLLLLAARARVPTVVPCAVQQVGFHDGGGVQERVRCGFMCTGM